VTVRDKGTLINIVFVHCQTQGCVPGFKEEKAKDPTLLGDW
jgi:hypothetical protein